MKESNILYLPLLSVKAVLSLIGHDEHLLKAAWEKISPREGKICQTCEGFPGWIYDSLVSGTEVKG